MKLKLEMLHAHPPPPPGRLLFWEAVFFFKYFFQIYFWMSPPFQKRCYVHVALICIIRNRQILKSYYLIIKNKIQPIRQYIKLFNALGKISSNIWSFSLELCNSFTVLVTIQSHISWLNDRGNILYNNWTH